MLHSSHRAILRLAGIAAALAPALAFAEVSDKEPVAALFWTVGAVAGPCCLLLARLKPGLGLLSFVPALLWFVSLFMELHSADVGPHLLREQGMGYYLQAYAAFGLIVLGLTIGVIWHRKARRP